MYGSLVEGGGQGYSRFLETSYDESVQLAFFNIDGERRIKSYNTDKHPCRLRSYTTADNSMVRSMSILRALVMVGAIEVASVIDRKGLAGAGSWFICLSNLTFGHLYFSNWNGGG